MKEFLYYYMRDEKRTPVITVCLYINEGQLSKGISICSLRDVVNKKEGRRIARARALKAMGQKKSSDPIDAMRLPYLVCPDLDCEDKCQYSPELSEFERNLLHGKI